MIAPYLVVHLMQCLVQMLAPSLVAHWANENPEGLELQRVLYLYPWMVLHSAIVLGYCLVACYLKPCLVKMSEMHWLQRWAQATDEHWEKKMAPCLDAVLEKGSLTLMVLCWV